MPFRRLQSLCRVLFASSTMLVRIEVYTSTRLDTWTLIFVKLFREQKTSAEDEFRRTTLTPSESFFAQLPHRSYGKAVISTGTGITKSSRLIPKIAFIHLRRNVVLDRSLIAARTIFLPFLVRRFLAIHFHRSTEYSSRVLETSRTATLQSSLAYSGPSTLKA